jgi:FPC/CPF motif-containing protein YcgG
MLCPANDVDHPLTERFRRFVVARDFRSAWDDLRILPSLLALAGTYRAEPTLFQSLVVLFEEGAPDDEAGFEAQLWERLQSLTDKDQWLGQPADPRVAHDPGDPHFAMSFGGEAFFVVGLHPHASRPARRFETSAMVFNLHDQFEQLRMTGRYNKLRETILDRDVALAGTSNPMLADHGSLSAARQYSGRAVGAEWRCPFSGRARANSDDPLRFDLVSND